MSKKPKCWFCWSKWVDVESVDTLHPTVNIGPKAWCEFKVVLDPLKDVQPICEHCQKEIRSEILWVTKMLICRRGELETKK